MRSLCCYFAKIPPTFLFILFYSLFDDLSPLTSVYAAPTFSMEAPPTKVHHIGDAVVEHHSNDNLLKMECFDSYATPGNIRKHMLTQLQNAVKSGKLQIEGNETTAASSEATSTEDAGVNASVRPLLPYLPGLCRVGKNPKSTHVFLAFTTEEQRELAKERLSQFVCYRGGRYWTSLPVLEHDLALTNRGTAAIGQKREREDGGADGEGKEADDTRNDEKKGPKKETGDSEGSNAAAWANVSYDSQIYKKTNHCRGIMRQISSSSRINQAKAHFKIDITEEEKCAFLPPNLLAEKVTVLPSLLLHGYRNHVNFSCGYCRRRQVFGSVSEEADETSNEEPTIPAIGMMAGATVDGKSSIDPIAISATDFNGQSYGVDDAFQKSFKASASIMMVTNALSVSYGMAVMRAHDRIMSISNNRVGMFDKKRAILVAATGGTGEEGHEPRCLFWKRVQVRHNVDGDVMIDVECDDTNLKEVASAINSDAPGLLAVIRATLVEECLRVEDISSPYAYAPPTPTPVVVEMSKAPEKRVDETGKERVVLIPTMDDSKCSILPKCRLVSLQWHFFQGAQMCPPTVPRQLIYSPDKPQGDAEGENTVASKQLVEVLCGYKFRLSPTAFFQVNTPTAAAMLDEVASVAKLSPEKTTLLDLCCGTGIIGICLSTYVKRIIGIEMIADAIEDAKVNAELNGVNTPDLQKATYYAAKVEDALTHALNRLTPEEKEDVVVIFDPPRAGMHPSVLKSVRSVASIRRIVYISCDQNALLRDVPPLTKEPTNQFKGIPFGVVGGMGVDLFPHTPHVEMIAVLQRRSVL